MTTVPDNLAASPTVPRARSRRRRWLVRIPVIVAATVVTIVVLVQAFLWTDYPRKIAQAQVERILHVRTTIDRVSIGWLGHTRIEGVALTLPMESEPFLQIARIDAQHASLPLIAFDQDLSDVRVSGVSLTARQDVSGRWNVQQLLASRGKSPPDPTAKRPSNPLAELPSFRASDVRATLIRNDGKQVELPKLDAELQKPDALTATLTAHAGESISVSGELGQSAALPQSLKAKVSGLPPDVLAFFNLQGMPAVQADVEWQGRLTDAGVAGTLRLVDVSADRTQATGRVEIDVGAGGRIVARPTDLTVTVANGAIANVHATTGQIAFEEAFSIDNLGGTLNGGRFALSGTFDPATLAADISANWEQVMRDTFATTGSARLRTVKLFNGDLKIDVDARGGARFPGGEAIGAFAVSGSASSAEQFDASVTLDPFTWTPTGNSPPIVTPRLTGDVSMTGNDIRLQASAPSDPQVGSLEAYAGGDRSTKIWWASLDATSLRLPAVEARGVKGPVDVSLAVSGDGDHVDVQRAYAKLDKGGAYATGYLALSVPQTVKMRAWAWYDKPVTEDEAAQLNSLKAAATIDGTITPMKLAADVDLDGTALVVATRRVGDVALHVTGTLDEDEAIVRSQEIEALGGRWAMRGRWSPKERGPATIVTEFRDVPMSNIGELIDRHDLGGRIESGMATLRVRSSRLDQLDVIATAHGASLAAGPLHAETLDLGATLKAGRFEVKPTFRESGGSLTADVSGEVSFTTPVRAKVTLQDWPAPYFVSTFAGAERFRPRASGTGSVEAALRTRSVSGDVALAGVVERDDSKLADFRLEAALRDKLITVSQASLDTLDGKLSATAQVDLSNYDATIVNATFDNLTPARLSWSNPLAGEVQGRVNGTFAVRPSVAPRAIGPLELELNVRPETMSFRGVNIGDLSLLAYADLKQMNEFRLVTDRAVLNLAGGRIEGFARLSSEPERGVAQLITANFRGINLGEVVRAVDNDGKELVGKVAGRVQLFGQTTNLKTLTGTAAIDISESDLVNFGPIAALYNALNIGTAGKEPIGTGTLSLRFGGDDLIIDDATYFNRGVYANAFGAVRGLSSGTDAQVDHALVIGSLQPLRSAKLPFLGDVNDALAALQSSVTAIDVEGPLKEPKTTQVSLNAVGDTFQKLILGKTRENK